MTDNAKSRRPKSLGFGFDPTESPYHFVLRRRGDGGVSIIEAIGRANDDEAEETEKARLSSYLWERIESPVATEFNDRLRGEGGRAGRWLKDETLLAPHFGKELTLLFWAVEDADPTLVPSMIANWRGLAPEERWWFYTTINATSSHSEHGKDRGWRKAIKIAFADNPVHIPPSSLLVGPMPVVEKPKRTGAKARAAKTNQTSGRLRLFDLKEEPS